MILFSRRHPVNRDDSLDLYEISSLRPAKPRHLAGGLLLIAGGSCASALYFHLMSALIPETVRILSDSLLAVLHSESLLMMLLGTAFFPAICEELLFRGLIQYSFTRHVSDRYAVLATALLFASFHLSPLRMPSTFFTGLLLGYALCRSGSILVPMLMHLAGNTVSALLTVYPLTFSPGPVSGALFLGITALAALVSGAALMEEHPVKTLSRHPVAAVVIAAAVLAMMTAAALIR